MAFSTQKEFFHVPFMNETVDYECRKACVKLKTYQSTIDHRSWAMDESLQSRFLSDLINCQSPIGGFGDGDVDDDYDNAYDADGTGEAGRTPGRGKGTGRSAGRAGGRPKQAAGSPTYVESDYFEEAGMRGDQGPGPSGRGQMSGPGGGKGGQMSGPGGGKGGLITADSVLACANEQMGRMQELLLHKKNLEKQLEVSNERLKVSNMENDKIKAIMNNKFDGNNSKDFYNKIQKLTSGGKISKGEENELLQIYNKFEDMSKAYEILQAENAYLKRLMEKLSLRASFEALKVEPEKSNDTAFLQNEVNKLRKEVSILRKFEDDKLKRTMDSNRTKMSDQDAETLKVIIKERNALREKCKTFKDLEAKVYELQKIAKEADKMSDSLSNDLDSQSKHINKMEHEMKQMQDYYEDQIAKHKFNEDILRCQLDEMKEELIRARCSAQKADCLQMEIGSLRNELMRRELALNDYNCQYNQLMSVIDELQNNAIQNLHDTQTQTCTDYMDDLAFFARATLNEINKEIKKRGGDGDKIGGPAITDGISPDECCAELRRMQELVKQLTKQNEYLQNNMQKAAEDFCADAFKKLREMEEKYKKAQDDISYLKKDKDALNMHAMDKLNEFSHRVDKMGTDVGKTALDTAYMDKDLKESMKLVKEISDIQLKNVQLTNAVNALNTRDDQSIIDDLRRQLLEEQAKNRKCQEENKKLRELLEKRGIDPALATKDIIKDVADVSKGGPAIGLDVQKGGLTIGPDIQKGAPSVPGDIIGPEKGGPFIGKDVGPEVGKAGGDIGIKGVPVEKAVVRRDAGKNVVPDPLDLTAVGVPAAGKTPTPSSKEERGRQEATQPVLPGAVGEPAAAKPVVPTAGPAAATPGAGGPTSAGPGIPAGGPAAGSPAARGPTAGGTTTGGPGAGGPTMGGPAAAGPALGAPTAGGPATGAPTAGGPAAAGPAAGGPAAASTAAGGPAAAGPAAGGPAAGGPALGAPTAGGPAAAGPGAGAPTAGGPAAAGPAAAGPAAAGPAAGGPAAGGPAAAGPAAAGPAAAGPAAAGPGAGGPAAAGPGAGGPAAAGPGAGGPTAGGGPGTGRPGAVGPAAGGPTGGGPSAGGPAAGGPAAGGPTAGGPTAGGPATGGPATGGPAAGGPTAGGPTAGGPATGGPATGGPAAGGPTAGGPTARGPAAGGPTAGGPTARGPAAGGPTAGGPPAGGPAAGGPTAGGPTAGGPTTGGTAAVPGTDGPTAGGPGAVGPTASGPATSRPGAVGPAAGGPGAVGTAARGPAAGGPGTVGPAAGGPAARGPAARGPGAVNLTAGGRAAGGPGIDGAAAGGPGLDVGDVDRPGAVRKDEFGVGEVSGGPGMGTIGGTGPVGDGSAIGDGESGGKTGIKSGKGEGIDGGVPSRGPIGRGGPTSGGGKSRRGKGTAATADSDAFQQFIDNNANTMISNIRAGSALEKELRAILNSFMMECGFCFCKSLVPKSKFYALCHKLLHNGIQCMSFRELAYMHRKIFMAADKLHPGCLLNMILTELGFKDGEGLKCCHCKNALCCSNSEEMLKEKVSKLERDIEMAKEYLDSLKAQPKTPKNPYTSTGKTYRHLEDSYSEAVEELLTCRETRPVLSRPNSKQMKTLKARIMRCSEMMR